MLSPVLVFVFAGYMREAIHAVAREVTMAAKRQLQKCKKVWVPPQGRM
jgi:hypothetical protein